MGLSGASTVLVAMAALTAGVGGWGLGTTWLRARESAARLRRVRQAGGAAGEDAGSGIPDKRVVRYIATLSHRLALGVTVPLLQGVGFARAGRWYEAHAKRAGLDDAVSMLGFVEASKRIGLVALAGCALVGAVLSTELALLGAVLGAAGGLTAPQRAVKRAERVRAAELERDLSEMLEVVSLGLRSGLSFDRSFDLYGAHFNSVFARECASAQRAWTIGLTTREAALREVASSYDSALLTRVVEGMVRSLRFGSSMAESLEAAASEARAERRASVEERVAKAPVKMMVPTGTLILPAMLLLVLGPVLLELMEGF